MEPGDLREILRINEDSSPAVCKLSAVAAAQLTIDASLAWVVAVDRLVVGYLIGYLRSAPYRGEEFLYFKKRTADFIYIDQIALASSHRAHGIGSTLYAQLESWAKRRRYTRLTCEVNLDPPNPGSLAFHQHHGFVEVRRMHTADRRWVALLQREIA